MDEAIQQEFNVEVASRLGALEAGQEALKGTVEGGFKALRDDLRRYARANNLRVARLEDGHQAQTCLRFHGGISAELDARDRVAAEAAKHQREDTDEKRVTFAQRWLRVEAIGAAGSFAMAGAAILLAVFGG